MDPIEKQQFQSWEDQQYAMVGSWWGAFGALMLFQAYSFILLQGLMNLFSPHKGQVTALNFVVIPFLILFALAQVGGLRVMDRYLRTHGWRTALRFWHTPFEFLRFLVALVCTAAYVYLLTGHMPIPRNPALYRDIGIIGNLLFQLFNLALSYVVTLLWKTSDKMRASGRYDNTVDDSAGSLVGMILAIPMGMIFIGVACYRQELFYATGIIGYGMIMLGLAQLLPRSADSWKNR